MAHLVVVSSAHCICFVCFTFRRRAHKTTEKLFTICRRIKIKRKSQFCLYLLNKKNEEDIINITLLALLRVGGELKSSPRASPCTAWPAGQFYSDFNMPRRTNWPAREHRAWDTVRHLESR